eukprot:366325-Chlamydomonas_euryale.AAC.3
MRAVPYTGQVLPAGRFLEGGLFWRHGSKSGLRFELNVHQKAVVHFGKPAGLPMVPLSSQTNKYGFSNGVANIPKSCPLQRAFCSHT